MVVRAGQRVTPAGLEADAHGLARESALQAASDERLEQDVHREQQGEARRAAARRALPVSFQEQAGEAVKVVEGGVGPVQLHRFAERVGAVAHELETGGELGQKPGVGGGSREAGEPRRRRLEHAVERRVLRQFVEAAGEPVRPGGEMRDLARDVELPAQKPQVLLVRDVASGQPAPDGGQQPLGEQPDEEFQQVVPLRVQGGEIGIGHAKVEHHGEHPDESRAHRAVVAVVAIDLGQDLDGPAGNREDADDLPRLEVLVGGTGQHGRLGQLEPPGSAFGEGVEPPGLGLGQAVFADRQGLPLPEGERPGQQLTPLRLPHP